MLRNLFETKLHENVVPILTSLFRKSSRQLLWNMNIYPYPLASTASRRAMPAHRQPICYFVFMRLVINGEERNLAASTLDALIEELGMKGDRIAVELNRNIVPRATWSATPLSDGDRLEIVHFVGGGKI